MRHVNNVRQRGRRAVRALTVGLGLGALSACDLSVDLPHLLTDAAIEAPRTAETQVMSAMALYECALSSHGWMALGHEDTMESLAGVASTVHRHRATPVGGTCDAADTSQSWFDTFLAARAMISTSPARLVPTGEGAGRGVYDRIQDEWSLGQEGERLSAIAAVYMAGIFTHLGEFLCEAAFDGSDLVTPNEMLDLAEDWVTNRALVHINNVGDFAMPNGASPSARNMALGLRARARWARGDLAGAAADAQTILGQSPRFAAWVTREAGPTRRNKIHQGALTSGFSGMLGVNDFWNVPDRTNPVTGQPWPNPIPHTGYIFLGIMPDGRALEAGNIPVRWAQEQRDGDEDPVPLNNGAVADTRVTHVFRSTQSPVRRELPTKYTSDSDDMPLVTWRELTFMLADNDRAQGNLAGAISRVNDLRAFHGLPLISGAYEAQLLGDTNAVRHVLLEERRRELYSEGGRYWSTKIQNTDVLWFPREQGNTPFQGYELLGGVRQFFGADEYERNPHFQARGGLNARGTGCDPSQAPVVGSV